NKYIELFADLWEAYTKKTGRDFADFEAICFRLPYTRMGEKPLKPHLENMTEDVANRVQANYKLSTKYNRLVGNIYTGSLYLSLLSLLENSEELVPVNRIGLFSYGSGSVGEFFTGILEEDFDKYLNTTKHKKLFENREELTIEEYENEFLKELTTVCYTVEFNE